MSIDLDRAVSTAIVHVWDAIDGEAIWEIAQDVIRQATWKKVSPFVQKVIEDWDMIDINLDATLSTKRILELATAMWLEHQPRVHNALCKDYESSWIEVNFR